MQILYYNGGFEHLQEFAQLAAKPMFNSENPVDAVIFQDLRKGSCIETVRHKPSKINARTSEFRFRSAFDLLQDRAECEEFFTLEDKLRTDKSAPDLNRYQELLEKQQEAAKKQYADWYGIVKGNLPANVEALVIPGWNDTLQINEAAKGVVSVLNVAVHDIGGKKIAGIGALDPASQRVPYDLAAKFSEFESKDQPEETFIASNVDADILVVGDPVAGYCDKKLPQNQVSKANRLANFVRTSVVADWSLDGIAKQKHKLVITPAASAEPRLAWTMVNDSIVLNAGPSRSVRKPLAYLITYGDRGVEAPIIALEPDGRHHPVLTEENIKHPPASRYGTRITRAVRAVTPVKTETPVVVLPKTTRKSTAVKKAPAGMSPLEMTIGAVWKKIEPHVKNLGVSRKDAIYAIKDTLMDTELHSHVERIEALESTIDLAAYDLTGAAQKYSRDLITAYVGYLGKTSFVSRKPELFRSIDQLSKSLPRRHLKAVKDKLKEYQKECRELQKQLNNVYQSYGMAYRFAKRAGNAFESGDLGKSRELYEHAHMVAPFEQMKQTLAFNVGFVLCQQAEAGETQLYAKALEWFKNGPRDADTRDFVKYCRAKANENAA